MVIVISSPKPIRDELTIIRQLFIEGLETFHLRKKDLSEPELREFIEAIPEEYFSKIVLHSQYHLVQEYGLKGIHVPVTFEGDFSCNSISVSFHSLEEIGRFRMPFNYAFLSPIFDSISKEGYKGNLDLSKIKNFQQKEKLVALGGIDENNLDEVRTLGFSGIALLGAIWQNESPIEKFKRIKEKWTLVF